MKAALDLDWDDLEAREQALRQALQTLERVGQWLATNPELITEESVVPDCLEAARQVRTQDVTTNEAGEPVLVKGVAKGRRISIEDAEMRHGRKSRSVRVDGYKRHVMRDLDSELVVAVGITPANAPEASVAEEIKSDLRRQQITLKELHIDRAYLSSTLVRERSAELEIFCKAWPARAGAFFPKTAFLMDWEREVLRCPQGIEMSCQPGKTVRFPAKSCAAVRNGLVVRAAQVAAALSRTPTRSCCKNCVFVRARVKDAPRCVNESESSTICRTPGIGKASAPRTAESARTCSTCDVVRW